MKTFKSLMLGLLAVLIGIAAAQAAPLSSPCGLINEMGGVFKILRTLCFAGAAFVIMGWAWGYIMKGESATLDDAKKKGVGMLVGFALLFSVGIIMTLLPNMVDCPPNW